MNHLISKFAPHLKLLNLLLLFQMPLWGEGLYCVADDKYGTSADLEAIHVINYSPYCFLSASHDKTTLKKEITFQKKNDFLRDTIVGWTFPQANMVGANYGIEQNLGNQISREADFTGNYNFPVGASDQSISTNNWTQGADSKFWMVELSTIGYEAITVSSKQRSSNSGPRDFILQYRVGSQNQWNEVINSKLNIADNFSTGVLEDIELPEECNHKFSLFLRWIMSSNTSVGDLQVASAGTSRIDDIFIHGVFSEDYKRIINEVDSIDSIEVSEGTSLEELNIPKTIQVHFEDGGSAVLEVDWDTTDFDNFTPGSYTINGNLILPPGTENPKKLVAQIVIHVLAEIKFYTVTFQLDMQQAENFDVSNDEVYISGSMFDNAIPGTLPNKQLMSLTANMIYVISMTLQEGPYSYKYYINGGLSNPEPGTYRTLELTQDSIISDAWVATSIHLSTKPTIKLYPNPAHKSFFILSEDIRIYGATLYDLRGDYVYSWEFSNNHQYYLPNLPNALFILEIDTSEGIFTKKIWKTTQ